MLEIVIDEQTGKSRGQNNISIGLAEAAETGTAHYEKTRQCAVESETGVDVWTAPAMLWRIVYEKMLSRSRSQPSDPSQRETPCGYNGSLNEIGESREIILLSLFAGNSS